MFFYGCILKSSNSFKVVPLQVCDSRIIHMTVAAALRKHIIGFLLRICKSKSPLIIPYLRCLSAQRTSQRAFHMAPRCGFYRPFCQIPGGISGIVHCRLNASNGKQTLMAPSDEISGILCAVSENPCRLSGIFTDCLRNCFHCLRVTPFEVNSVKLLFCQYSLLVTLTGP